MANNLKALRKLQAAMPVLDKKRKQQQEQARAVQLQQQVAQQPTVAPVAATAQQLGAQSAQAAGQAEVQAAQARQQQLAGQAGAALAAEQAQSAQEIGNTQLGLGERKLDVAEEMGDKVRSAEDKMFQNQIDFKRDELGRSTYQGHQQLDLALASAQSSEDFKDKMQIIEQTTKEHLSMLESTINRLKIELKGEGSLKRQDLTLETQTRLQNLIRDTENDLKKKQAEAAGKGAMFSAIGGVAGGVAGGFFGGPVGVGVGSAAGSGVGSMAGGLFG